jgi:HK97 family phage portal protein
MRLLEKIAVKILKRSLSTSSLSNPERWFVELMGGGASKSGTTVNTTTALYSTVVYACVRILAESVAALPLHTYRRLPGGGKERATKHPAYQLLHLSPNPEVTSLEWREAMMGHLGIRGNAYSEIEWGNNGYPKGLWPFSPDRVNPQRINGEIVYDITMPSGEGVRLPADRILHLRGFSPNGIIGYSPIALHKEPIGLSLAAEEYGARFFANDSQPAGVLEHPGQLDEPARENIKKSWKEMHEGLEKSHRMALLEEGMKWQQTSINPQDSQLLETRKFQVAEICRIYRIPPHMVADLEKATFSNIEHQSLEFVVHTLMPWLIRWEMRMTLSLLTPKERSEYFIAFLVAGLLRGDLKSRYEAYAIGRQWGWLSADDIRELEDMNPLPKGQGQSYLVPLNMVPAAEKREARGDIDILLAQRALAGWDKIFEEAAGRIIRREAADITQFSEKYLSREDRSGFKNKLDAFYRDHPEYVRKQVMPAILGLGESVCRQAFDDFGIEVNLPALQVFVKNYAEKLTARFVADSRKEVEGTLQPEEIKKIFERRKSERVKDFSQAEPVLFVGELIAEIRRSAGLS